MSARTIPPASRPFPELLVEGFRHREGRRSLDAVEAAEQRVGRSGNGLHDHAAARRLAHPLDDHARSRKSGFNEVVRRLARGGRPGEAEDATIGCEHDEVGLRGVDGARFIERFVDDGVVAAQNHVDQHAVTEARTLDRRGEERQGSVADQRDLDRRELRRGAGQGLRDALPVSRAGSRPDGKTQAGGVRGRPRRSAPAFFRALTRARKSGGGSLNHARSDITGVSLTLFDLSWKRWRRPARQRCAGARSRRWRT